MSPRLLRPAIVVGLLLLSGPAAADLILSSSHAYAYGGDPTAVEIDVEVFDEFEGDPTKYLWKYTVTNNSYDPNPGASNGFSGFELALPVFVPDIADVFAPSDVWEINCCSGLPVEWDVPNSAGTGLLPGDTGMFGFTTAPRPIAVSTGWFHTWQGDIQTDLVYYPEGEGPEVPFVPEPATGMLLGLGLVGLARRRRAPVALAIVAVFLAPAAARSAPILVNGSLTGTVDANAAAPGWVVANTSPDVVGPLGPFNNTGVPWALSPDGGTWARSIGTSSSITIEEFEQTVSGFEIGEVYRLDFFQTNMGFLVGGAGGAWRKHPGVWALFVNDVEVGRSDPIAAPSLPSDPIEWVSDRIAFTATAETLTLRLGALTTAAVPQGSADYGYMGIDGLTLVPEPSTALLLGLGLGACGAARRRRGSVGNGVMDRRP